MRIKLAALVVFLAAITISCDANYSRDEICSESNDVYTSILDHRVEWTEHFAEREYANPIVVYVGVYRYIVDSLYRTNTGDPIISISVDEGFPATRLGVMGIVFIPDGRTDAFGYGEHELRLINSNVYCYYSKD